jgi:aryl-alcohol dehydrogenase-like predicted oxidoreductase
MPGTFPTAPCRVRGLALAAVLAQPWTDVVLSGAATVAQLIANSQATALPWTPALAGQLSDLAEPPQRYWGSRSRLPWN